MPIGVVNLAERHGGREVTAESYEAMVADVMAAYFEKEHRFGDRIARKRAHFLGTSGTVTTISGIHLKLPCLRALAGRRLLANGAMCAPCPTI